MAGEAFLYSGGEKSTTIGHGIVSSGVFRPYRPGTGLASVPGMYRRAGLLPLATVAAFLLIPAAQLEPQGQAGNPPANRQLAPAPPAVRLEHQIIEVQPPKTPTRPPRRRVAPVATRLASLQGHSAGTLVARARRAFIGDGRYRPEPFPRLNR